MKDSNWDVKGSESFLHIRSRMKEFERNDVGADQLQRPQHLV